MLASRAALTRDEPWVPSGDMFPLEESSELLRWRLQTKPAVKTFSQLARRRRCTPTAPCCTGALFLRFTTNDYHTPRATRRKGSILLKCSEGENLLLPPRAPMLAVRHRSSIVLLATAIPYCRSWAEGRLRAPSGAGPKFLVQNPCPWPCTDYVQ